MQEKTAAVFGVCATIALAEEAVDHLIAERFPSDSISVLLRDPSPSRPSKTKAPGVGTLGLLAGLKSLEMPGSGVLIGAGPAVSGLAGRINSGDSQTLAALLGLKGVSESNAKRYERNVGEGRVLVAVHCQSDETSRAESVLQKIGAQETSIVGSASNDWEATAMP